MKQKPFSSHTDQLLTNKWLRLCPKLALQAVVSVFEQNKTRKFENVNI